MHSQDYVETVKREQQKVVAAIVAVIFELDETVQCDVVVGNDLCDICVVLSKQC